MNFLIMLATVTYIILSDTATPAVNELIRNIAPAKLQARIGPALADLMRRNYLTLPPNKMGAPTTHFWQQAADAVRWERLPDGVMIITDKIGVRQRLLGGVIRPLPPRKNIAIPANALAYGKTPAEFATLKFVMFGRGQNAPKALVMAREDVTHIGQGKRKKFAAAALEKPGGVVMFWLKSEVTQSPNPKVIPSDEQFAERIEQAIAPLKNLPDTEGPDSQKIVRPE